MDIYKARWEAAKKLVNDFKARCREEGAEFIMYDQEGDMIALDQLRIDEDTIYILFEDENTKSRCTYQLFENDKEWDHGLHQTIKQFRDEFLSSVKAYKQVKI